MNKFFNFKGGAKIEDWRINSWLKELAENYSKGAKYSSISSGDTQVSFMVWASEVEFFVANDSGRSVIRFGKEEFDTIETFNFNYTRP